MIKGCYYAKRFVDMRMNKAYLLLGGNIGDRLTNLVKARQLLKDNFGDIFKYSQVYETASWGRDDQPDFLNQALLVETNLSPQQLMRNILFIEEKLGRIRTEKNVSRIIDIDILFFNEETIVTKNIIIPHPQIQNRNFVLNPLNELAPELEHPILKKTVNELLLDCDDNLAVHIYKT